MICRELSESKAIRIGDCEFTIRMIPRRIFKKLSVELAKKQGQAQALRYDPTAHAGIMPPPEVIEASSGLVETFLEICKNGVIGHSGLQNAKGVAITFETNGDKLVSDSTLDIYELNGFISELASNIVEFNTLLLEDKKK